MHEQRELRRSVDLMEVSTLPPLKDGYVRLVHITHPNEVASTIQNGLFYQKHGMLMSVARCWEQASHCEFWSDDSRFSFDGAVAVVMDIPASDTKTHNAVGSNPGVVPAKYFVGVVSAKKPENG